MSSKYQVLGKHLLTPTSIEGQQLRYCGVGAGFDDVIVDGDLDALKVTTALVSYTLDERD